MRAIFAFLLCCICLYANDIETKLDAACKSDYESCLTLANLYDSKHSIDITAMINNNTKAKNLPAQPDSYIQILQQETRKDDQKISLSYYEKALPLLESACYYNYDSRACIIVSYIYESNAVVGKNTLKSARLITLALEHSTRACILHASKSPINETLSECELINKYPQYIKDISNKIDILEDNCKRSDISACYKSALFYYLRNNDIQSDIASDSAKSLPIIQKICKLSSNDCDSIREHAILYNPSADACFINSDMKACIKAGDILSNNLQSKLTGDLKTESMTNKNYPLIYVYLLALSCNNGNVWACYHNKAIPSILQSKKKYAAILRKSCKYGILQACIEATNRYKDGILFDKDYRAATTFASATCNIGMKSAYIDSSIGDYCYFAANELESGEHVDQNIRGALDFYALACIATKSLPSCKRAISLQNTMNKTYTNIIAIHKTLCDLDSSAIDSCMIAADAFYDSKKNTEWTAKTYMSILDNPSLSKKYADMIKMKITYINSGKYDNISRDYTQAYYDSKYVHSSIPNLSALCNQKDYVACINMADWLNKQWSAQKHGITDSKELDNINDNIAKFHMDTNLKPYDLYLESCLNKQKAACDKLAYNHAFTMNEESSDTIQIPKDLRPYIHKLSAICNANIIDYTYCINMATEAFNNKQYDYVIEILKDKYTLDSNIDSNDNIAKKILEMLLTAYFNQAKYDKVLYIYKIIYSNNISNDYAYLITMYEKGLGVDKNANIARDMLNNPIP